MTLIENCITEVSKHSFEFGLEIKKNNSSKWDAAAAEIWIQIRIQIRLQKDDMNKRRPEKNVEHEGIQHHHVVMIINQIQVIKSDCLRKKSMIPMNKFFAGVSDRAIVVALYDYDAIADSDISFRKDDRMEIISDADSADWCNVRHLGTGHNGWVPKNYVAPEKSIKSEEYVSWLLTNFPTLKSAILKKKLFKLIYLSNR